LTSMFPRPRGAGTNIFRAEAPKKRKAPVRKPAGEKAEKVPRAKKVKDKDKVKAIESGVEDTPPAAIAQ